MLNGPVILFVNSTEGVSQGIGTGKLRKSSLYKHPWPVFKPWDLLKHGTEATDFSSVQ